MIAAVTPTADMHPAVTITENTIPTFNITTGKDARLFNKAEIHFKSHKAAKGNVFLGKWLEK